MAKKFNKLNCVYCLKYHEELTSDHVFPRSWYPDNTPSQMEKWQVPACRSCNGRYGDIERQLLERLALGLDSADAAALGIPERMLRAHQPSKARTRREREVRTNKLKKLMSELHDSSKVPMEACIPGFGLRPGIAHSEQPALLIQEENLTSLGAKIARGSMYYLYKRYIDDQHAVKTYIAKSEAAAPFLKLIEQHGEKHYCGPGVTLGLTLLPQDPQSALWYIEFWQRFRMYVVSFPLLARDPAHPLREL